MRALRRVAIATLAAGALVSTLGAGSALAFQPVSFTYDVTNLGPGTHFQAVYSGGADHGLGGSAQAGTGEISYAGLFPNGVVLFPQPAGAPLTADVQQWVRVTNCSLQGVATVPGGTTVTLTNNTTNQQVMVNNGRFQIPTGMCGLGAAPRKSRSQTITCKGSAPLLPGDGPARGRGDQPRAGHPADRHEPEAAIDHCDSAQITVRLPAHRGPLPARRLRVCDHAQCRQEQSEGLASDAHVRLNTAPRPALKVGRRFWTASAVPLYRTASPLLFDAVCDLRRPEKRIGGRLTHLAGHLSPVVERCCRHSPDVPRCSRRRP